MKARGSAARIALTASAGSTSRKSVSTKSASGRAARMSSTSSVGATRTTRISARASTSLRYGTNKDCGSTTYESTLLGTAQRGPLTRRLGSYPESRLLGQPGLDRVDGRLGSRRDVELGEDPADVVLDRLLREVQLGADLLVAHPAGDQADDLGLADRQLVLGRASEAVGPALQDAAGDARVDVGVAARHALHGPDQLGREDVLDDVAVGAGREAALHDLGLRSEEHTSELQSRQYLVFRPHRLGELDVVAVEVEDDQVGPQPAQRRGRDRCGVADHVDLRVARQNLAEGLPEEGLAFHDEHANRLGGRRGGGRDRSEHVFVPQSFGEGRLPDPAIASVTVEGA